MEANNEFLAKENAEEYNGEDAGGAKIKGKKRRSRLQEQQRKAGKIGAEEAPPPVEGEEPKAKGRSRRRWNEARAVWSITASQ